MKTAEELWNKYELLSSDYDENGILISHKKIHTDCMFYDDFFKAIAEHNKEITDKIRDKLLMDDSDTPYCRGYRKALTELLAFIEGEINEKNIPDI